MLVFGGYGEGKWHGEVWSLPLEGSTSWTQLAPAGPPPAPRADHVAVYDPVRRRMLVLGGQGKTPFEDVWALSLGKITAWERLTPAGPHRRRPAGARRSTIPFATGSSSSVERACCSRRSGLSRSAIRWRGPTSRPRGPLRPRATATPRCTTLGEIG